MRSATSGAPPSAATRPADLISPARAIELHHALQSMLPLCALPAAQVATMIHTHTASAVVPDAYSAAVHAARIIAAAAPRAGGAGSTAAASIARSFSAPLRVSSSSNGNGGVESNAAQSNHHNHASSNGANVQSRNDGGGAGSLHQLCAGLVWILDSSPLSIALASERTHTTPAATKALLFPEDTRAASTTAVPSISPLLLPALISLDALVAHSAPVRRTMLEGSLLLRTLARLSLESFDLVSTLQARIESDLFKPVLSGVEDELGAACGEARRILERSLGIMIHLTAADSDSLSDVESEASHLQRQQQQHAPGPVPPHAMLAALVNRLVSIVVAGPSKSTAIAGPAQAADAQFMHALELLGNLVLRVPWINSLVQSNSSSAASSTSAAIVPPPPNNPMATSTTLSPVPLKALYRQLIACLSCSQMELVAHALRLVAHLALTETSSKLPMQQPQASGGARSAPMLHATQREKQGVMEGKLFNASNTEQTFELVFNIILQAAGAGTTTASASGEVSSSSLLQPALQILSTLTSSPALLRALASYSGLQANLKAIVRLVGRRVAAASSSTTGAVAAASESDAQVCISLVRLLRSLLSHRSAGDSSLALARVVALHLLVDAESLEVLLNQVSFSRDAQLAQQTLRLLGKCNEVAGEWQRNGSNAVAATAVAASSKAAPSPGVAALSFHLGALYMPHALSDQAALPSLVRMLTTEAFRDAWYADGLAQKEQSVLEQSLRAENSTVVAACMDGSSSSSSCFAQSGSLVSLMQFLTPLLVHDETLRGALEPHFLLSPDIVAELVSSASSESPRNREVFALVRLLAAFRSDPQSPLGDAYDEVMRALYSSDAHSTPSGLASLLGHSLSLSAPADRLCVEDALHFVTLCEQTSLAQMASGLQRFNRSASRDAALLSTTLAAERVAHASLLSSFVDQRSSVHTSSVASADREKDLLRRLAEAESKASRIEDQCEAKLSRLQEQQDAELRSVHAHASQALSELQTRLEQLESAASAQSLSHAELLARSESDLASALARASAAETAFADVSRRHQGLSRKLAEAGRVYEAQLEYASKLKAENDALRTEAQSHLDALQTELAASQKALSSSSAQNADLSMKLEDAWGKLVLLNRALGDSQKDLAARGLRESQQDARLRQMQAELARLGAEHSAVTQALQQREKQVTEATQALQQREREVAALDAALADTAAERDDLQAANVELKTELDAASDAGQAASERCAALSSTVSELRTQIASLQSEATESSAERSAQSARLEAAEAELKQHHQLAAMIHKLSGQAAAAAATGSNGAATR